MNSQKNGWIIINNLHTTSPKFVETCDAFFDACKNNGVTLTRKTNFDFVDVLNTLTVPTSAFTATMWI